jgi:hypothetical protein
MSDAEESRRKTDMLALAGVLRDKIKTIQEVHEMQDYIEEPIWEQMLEEEERADMIKEMIRAREPMVVEEKEEKEEKESGVEEESGVKNGVKEEVAFKGSSHRYVIQLTPVYTPL